MFTEFFAIGLAVILIAIIWALVGRRHLKSLVKALEEQWDLIHDDLRLRQDLVPNLVETLRVYAKNQGKLIDKLIKVRRAAAMESSRGALRIEREYDLTRIINKVIDLGRSFQDLSKDTNFLELRKEINDLEQNIEERANRYNEMIREYNRQVNSWALGLWAKAFGYKVLPIFEVEK